MLVRLTVFILALLLLAIAATAGYAAKQHGHGGAVVVPSSKAITGVALAPATFVAQAGSAGTTGGTFSAITVGGAFGGNYTLPSPPFTFTSSSIDCGTSCAYTSSVAPGTTIGNASATLSTGVFGGTWSTSGAAAAGFTFSANHLQANGATPTCTTQTALSLNIVATQAGGTNSPFSKAITVTCNPTSGGGAQPGSILPAGNWTLVFGDEFNGSSVDLSKWTVQDGDCCGFIHSNPAMVSESGGALIINTYFIDGNTYGGGNVFASTGNIYGPGYFEARTWSGSHYSIGPWGVGGNGDCAGDRTAGFEYDIAESWGGNGHMAVHYGGYGGCHVADISTDKGASPVVQGDTWHVLGMWWQPPPNGDLVFYEDGVENWREPAPNGSVPNGMAFTAGQYGGGNLTPLKVDWARIYIQQ